MSSAPVPAMDCTETGSDEIALREPGNRPVIYVFAAGEA